jgi:hypothetical protein
MFDVLPRPKRGGDSFCKTATSRREDDLCGVDVPVMGAGLQSAPDILGLKAEVLRCERMNRQASCVGPVYIKNGAGTSLRCQRRRDIAPTGELAGLPARDAPKSSQGLAESNGVRAGFTGPHPQRLFQFEYPYFSIPGVARPCDVANGLHYLFRDRIVHRNLDLCLGQKVDAGFGTAINLLVPGLAPVTMYFGDRDALNADISNRLPDLVQLEGFDDGGDQLHAFVPAFTGKSDGPPHHLRVLLIQNIADSVPQPAGDESTGYAVTSQGFAPIWRAAAPFAL